MSNNLNLSHKSLELIKLYEKMVDSGYLRTDDKFVNVAFSDMEIKAYKGYLREIFFKHNIKSLLDYGCGGSNYEKKNFDGNLSAKEYFNLNFINLYEPSRNIDNRKLSDAVLCFDVLEHIFITDLPTIIRDIFSYSTNLVVINVACYSASALLPNGENAHITVRPPLWWKGVIDSIAVEFPNINVQLLCSTAWRKVESFKLFKSSDWQEQEGFVVPL
jgi:hypothetical protein